MSVSLRCFLVMRFSRRLKAGLVAGLGRQQEEIRFKLFSALAPGAHVAGANAANAWV